MTRKEIIDAILEERLKASRKWGDRHDDHHDHGELAVAAAHLLAPDDVTWPFDEPPKEMKSRRRELIVAAAFIVSEIERLERKADRRLRTELEAAKELLAEAEAFVNWGGNKALEERIGAFLAAKKGAGS